MHREHAGHEFAPTGPVAGEKAAVCRSSSSGLAPDRGGPASRCHSAPNGTTAADRVATTQSVSRPVSAARSTASRASRVFPTPGPPASTTPPAGPADSAASIVLSSAVRPVSGQSAPTGPTSRSAVTLIPCTSTCGIRDHARTSSTDWRCQWFTRGNE